MVFEAAPLEGADLERDISNSDVQDPAVNLHKSFVNDLTLINLKHFHMPSLTFTSQPWVLKLFPAVPQLRMSPSAWSKLQAPSPCFRQPQAARARRRRRRGGWILGHGQTAGGPRPGSLAAIPTEPAEITWCYCWCYC